MNDLQYSLTLAGVALVSGVFVHNKWQEYRQRVVARRIFQENPEPITETIFSSSTLADRIEPVLGHLPVPPVIDERIDCILHLVLTQPISAQEMWQAQQALFPSPSLITKPFHCFGFDTQQGQWKRIDASAHDVPVGSFQHFRFALQLADRQACVTEAELASFCAGVRALAEHFASIVDIPSQNEVLREAIALDKFAAAVDIQIGVSVVSATGRPFPCTKLRGLAEAAGLVLQEDGSFHALHEEDGTTLFTLSNGEPTPFAPEAMKNLATHSLILTLDVPRVAQAVSVFVRMINLARHLARTLNGVLVDDNRAALNDDAVDSIRRSVTQFQANMASYGITAGSALALRLFA